MSQSASAYVAFDGDRRVAAGNLPDVARATKELLDRRRDTSVLIFDGVTSDPVDLDFRGTLGDILARLPADTGTQAAADTTPTAPRGPGRPKLGVVAREVTLLPKHWEWLAGQPGGASVALRRLVEEARRSGEERDRIRQAQDAAYRFMSAMAGNKPHYEDAIRALFANERARFKALIAAWPADVRDHTLVLAERAFHHETETGSS
ncbi:MAG TPA: DUF2239 family protein [Bradyrhizobium sp.]|nr:DUF2239 family protein [Bradyrhizobium sp.]